MSIVNKQQGISVFYFIYYNVSKRNIKKYRFQHYIQVLVSLINDEL